PVQAPDPPNGPALRLASGHRREATPWAGRPCAAVVLRVPVRGRGSAAARPRGSRNQCGLQLGEQLFKNFEPHRLFDRARHVETQCFAESERRLEDSAIEPADDQYWPAVVLVGKEASELDS